MDGKDHSSNNYFFNEGLNLVYVYNPTSKSRSFCDGYFDTLVTLCRGYCDESWVS